MNKIDHHKPGVTVVIPCLNEEGTLRMVIECAQKAFSQFGYDGEVVVADNGSTDNSKEIAQSLGAVVVDVPKKGYGSALTAGIEAASKPYVIMGDADDTYDFMESDRLVNLLQQGNEFVIGSRLRGHIEEGAMPPLHRYLGTPVLTYLINRFFSTRISDCNCGLRAFEKTAFIRMDTHSTGMEFASEMIIKAALLKLKIAEVPVTLRVDKRNRTPHLRTWQDGWRHLRFILAYATDRVLLIPAIFFIIIGMAGFVLLGSGPVKVGKLFMDYHFLFPSSLSLIIGTQLILFISMAKTFTGLAKYNSFLSTFSKIVTVEKALTLGAIFFIVGLTINVVILINWIQHYGSQLHAVRPAIAALTLMAIGSQIFCSSFFIGVLSIPRRLDILEAGP